MEDPVENPMELRFKVDVIPMVCPACFVHGTSIDPLTLAELDPAPVHMQWQQDPAGKNSRFQCPRCKGTLDKNTLAVLITPIIGPLCWQ
jgi:hypothetical protein